MMLGKNLVCLTLIAVILSIVVTNLMNPSLVNAQPTGSAGKMVQAGGGTEISPLLTFNPQNIEIRAGESVTWTNPTPVSEPHTATFMKDNKSFADFAAPFVVPNSTEFRSLDPNANAEPLFVPIPGENPNTKTVVTVNARSFTPVVIDSSGKNVTFLPPNSNYTMDGTESYVNSGWLWPEGQAPPGGPPITKFTVTFEKPGTYHYMCNVHPWMTGTVIVNPS